MALAEAELLYHLDILFFFKNFVQSHDAEVGGAVGNGIGNVVIAQKQQFHREVA